MLDSLMGEASLNVVEVRLFAAAISKLLQKLPACPEGIFLDACDVNEERFGRSVSELVSSGRADNLKFISRHKADSIFPVVSAASIVAKVIRDNEMERIRHEFGMSIEEMGSGYPSDPRTKRFLENWIKEKGVVPSHTRHAWKTTRKLEAKYLPRERTPQMQLSDFG